MTESEETRIALLEQRLDTIEKNYVSKDQFDPTKRIVYGFVGLILTAVGLGIIALVVNS